MSWGVLAPSTSGPVVSCFSMSVTVMDEPRTRLRGIRRGPSVTWAAAALLSSVSPGGMRAQLPRLARQPLSQLGQSGPEQRPIDLAISRSGNIAFTGGYDPGGHQVTVINSQGRVVGRIGKSGVGPGE